MSGLLHWLYAWLDRRAEHRIDRMREQGDVIGLIRVLDAPREDARLLKRAADALVALEGAGVEAELVRALERGSRGAAEVLARQKSTGAIPALVRVLAGGGPPAIHASRALEQLGALQALRDVAASDAPGARIARHAAERLAAQYEEPPSWNELLPEIQGPDPDRASKAAERALPRGGAPEAVRARLIAALERYLAEETSRALPPVQLLARQGEEGLARVLEAARRGHWPSMRALGRLGDRRAVVPLIEALQARRNPTVAAEALAEIGDPRAIPAVRAWANQAPRDTYLFDECTEADLAARALERLLSASPQREPEKGGA